METAVIDNGAGRVKSGMMGDQSPKSMSNCTGRMQKSMNVLVGDEVDAINNGSQLTYSRPFDRGYLVNWQIESEIWTRLFDSHHMNISPANHNLVVTEPPLNPTSLQEEMNEIIFEDYGFQNYCRRPAAWFTGKTAILSKHDLRSSFISYMSLAVSPHLMTITSQHTKVI